MTDRAVCNRFRGYVRRARGISQTQALTMLSWTQVKILDLGLLY